MAHFLGVAAIGAMASWSGLAFLWIFTDQAFHGLALLITVATALILGVMTGLAAYILDRLP